MTAELWLILPTYNEAANVEGVVLRAREVLGSMETSFAILVVDDGSPDGTADLAEALRREVPELQVLRRARKDGLGRAYAAGFAYALERGATYLFEMDADFSHDPADLPRLLAPVRSGAGLALGSRYVPGGGIEGWPASRRAISTLGCEYARRVLGVDVRDLTGGFKCFRADTLREISYWRVHSRGYGFQIETTYRVLGLGHEVVEVPIVFREREAGESKMTTSIALEAAAMVPALRVARLRRRLQARWRASRSR